MSCGSDVRFAISCLLQEDAIDMPLEDGAVILPNLAPGDESKSFLMNHLSINTPDIAHSIIS
jgi:hypothetical protein